LNEPATAAPRRDKGTSKTNFNANFDTYSPEKAEKRPRNPLNRFGFSRAQIFSAGIIGKNQKQSYFSKVKQHLLRCF
jgi:hypothetical protein